MNNKLDVWQVVSGAFLIPWKNRATFTIALANPVLLIVALVVGWSYAREYVPAWLAWGLLFAHLTLFTMLAVTCHRLVLLKLNHVHSLTALRWSMRETLFLGYLIAAYLIYNIVAYVFINLILIPYNFALNSSDFNPRDKPPILAWFDYITLLGKIFAIYVFARLSLVLPAIAVEQKISFKRSWQLTRGNGWRLAIIVSGLPWILKNLLYLSYRENATIYEYVILALMTWSLTVIEIAAISLSYHELIKNRAFDA